MATIHREFEIESSAEKAWDAVRNVGDINKLITFLGDVTVDGDRRTCDMGEQGRLDELIISVDDDRRRLAYAIVNSPFNFLHHSASMQIAGNGGDRSRFVWITDVKPDEAASALEPAIDAAVESFKHALG